MFGEPVEKGPLAFEHLVMSDGQIEPFGAVDFRKGLHFSASRRPLDLEGVAFDGLNVEVAFHGEAKDTFAGALADLAQRFKWSRECNPGFLSELPDRGGSGVLARIDFTFRD